VTDRKRDAVPIVIVADDDRDVREYLRLLLEEHGYRVRTSADGLRALQACTETSAPLLVTDVCMPKSDGLALIKACRLHLPDMRIIAMSAGEGGEVEDCLRRASEAGADAVYRKPFAGQALLDRLEALLDEQTEEP